MSGRNLTRPDKEDDDDDEEEDVEEVLDGS